MKIIQNKWINKFIPFPNFRAINLFGVLFVRGDSRITESTINHERIHTEQWRELWYIGFLVWYLVEWVVHLIRFRNAHLAYRHISFEREAYTMQSYTNYTKNRERFAFLNYIG